MAATSWKSDLEYPLTWPRFDRRRNKRGSHKKRIDKLQSRKKKEGKGEFCAETAKRKCHG